MTIVAGDPSAHIPLETRCFGAAATLAAPAECAPDEPAWLFYTSGTTGRPKGAVLSHRNLIAMAVNCLADICAFRPDDRLLHAAPLSHGSGMYLLPALSRGAENIIDAGGGFDPDRILRFVRTKRVTVLPFLAPTMIVRLLDADPTIRTPDLRAIVYGGAPIHLEHLRAALRRFGPVLTQLYGQGESPMTISYLPAWAHDGPRRRGAAIGGLRALRRRAPHSRRRRRRPAAGRRRRDRRARRRGDARLLAQRRRQRRVAPRRLAPNRRHRPLRRAAAVSTFSTVGTTRSSAAAPTSIRARSRMC